MNKILSLLVASSLFAAPAAFAAKMAQTHHCDMNGTEVSKTHKDCTKAGGKWAKGAPMSAASAAPGAPVNPGGALPSAPTAGKQSAPATTPPSRDPAKTPSLPANTSPTPNGNSTMTPPPGDRTPGN